MSARHSNATENQIVRDALTLLDDTALAWESFHGGDLSKVIRLRLGSGKDVVVKSGPHPDREGRMLHKLAGAGAHVPLPIMSSNSVLVLKDLGAAAAPSDQSWLAFGTNLRAMHSCKSDHYGWSEDYAFETVRIRNGWSDDWSAFWFEKRLAADIDLLPADVARRLEKLQPLVNQIVPVRPRPSLLHGDLWSGNVHFAADGAAYLIDPACYFGHSEVDLAMLTLFGSPPKKFWQAYGIPDEGWKLRRHAYQLWPALVHLRLFGAGYRAMVEQHLSALER